MPGPQPYHCIPFIFCIVGRGLDPSAGRRGRRPLQRSARLLLIANGHGGLWAGRPTHGPYTLLPRNGPVKSRLRAIFRHSRRFGCPGHSLTPKQPFPTPGYPRPGTRPRLRSAPRGSGTPTAPRSRAGPRCGRSPRPHCCRRRTAHCRRPRRQGAAIRAQRPLGVRASWARRAARRARPQTGRLSKYRATTARANSSALLENTAIRTPAALQPGQQRRHTGVRRGFVVHVGAIDLYQTRPASRASCSWAARRSPGLNRSTSFGDAVAHEVAVLRGVMLRPAVGGAHAVRGVGQVVDRVQQGAVQVKQYGFKHSIQNLKIAQEIILIIVAFAENSKPHAPNLPSTPESPCKILKKLCPISHDFMV